MARSIEGREVNLQAKYSFRSNHLLHLKYWMARIVSLDDPGRFVWSISALHSGQSNRQSEAGAANSVDDESIKSVCRWMEISQSAVIDTMRRISLLLQAGDFRIAHEQLAVVVNDNPGVCRSATTVRWYQAGA